MQALVDYDSKTIVSIITIVFMILASTNFGLFYAAIRGRLSANLVKIQSSVLHLSSLTDWFGRDRHLLTAGRVDKRSSQQLAGANVCASNDCYTHTRRIYRSLNQQTTTGFTTPPITTLGHSPPRLFICDSDVCWRLCWIDRWRDQGHSHLGCAKSHAQRTRASL